jgi:glyoxylase-like metal-dependent hydrolase (beta-lactamase superfamily II)
MGWTGRTITGTILLTIAMTSTSAREIDIRVFQINDHLLCFYDGRPAQASHRADTDNWADSSAFDVGVATYAIHRGDAALVYDTYPTTQDAQWVRDYLTKAGIRHFTVVNSHWHLDHVGGNAVYSDADRISTDKTIRQLAVKKAAIEAGTEWGPPAIKPLVIPNIGIVRDTNYYVGDIKVELRPVNIHSEDGLVMYLPGDHVLLAGDTLEDTVTFVDEPMQLAEHYRNLQKMKHWNVYRILPNHGNPDVISRGGYETTLIDATQDYLRNLIQRAHDANYLSGTLEDYVGDSVKKGWVSIWWAYRDAHESNLKTVSKAFRDRSLPELPK